jgi:hypothetical protein
MEQTEASLEGVPMWVLVHHGLEFVPSLFETLQWKK